MNTAQPAPASPVRIPANHTVTKRLGNWTTARQFQVRAHRGHAVLDLRSPRSRLARSRSTSTSTTPRSSC
jgi:hypothetical protein